MRRLLCASILAVVGCGDVHTHHHYYDDDDAAADEDAGDAGRGDDDNMGKTFPLDPWSDHPQSHGQTLPVVPTGPPFPSTPVQLVHAQTPNAQAQQMTIVVSPVPIARGAGPVGIEPLPLTAIVSWGSAGDSHEIEIDAFTGIQFSVFASFVTVNVRNDANLNPLSTLPINARREVSGGIALGAVSRQTPLQKTILAILAGGTIVQSLIDTPVPAAGILNLNGVPNFPEFARELIVTRSTNIAPFTAGSMTINFRSGGFGVLGSFDYAAGERMEVPLQIPAGTQLIEILNTSASAQFMIPVFNLGI